MEPELTKREHIALEIMKSLILSRDGSESSDYMSRKALDLTDHFIYHMRIKDR